MEAKEFWYNDTTYVNISANNRIGVTLYYGRARQYSIKASADMSNDTTKDIKNLLKRIKEEKKYINPVHGCTQYI